MRKKKTMIITVFLDGGYKFYIVSSKYLKSFTEQFMNYMRDN